MKVGSAEDLSNAQSGGVPYPGSRARVGSLQAIDIITIQRISTPRTELHTTGMPGFAMCCVLPLAEILRSSNAEAREG